MITRILHNHDLNLLPVMWNSPIGPDWFLARPRLHRIISEPSSSARLTVDEIGMEIESGKWRRLFFVAGALPFSPTVTAAAGCYGHGRDREGLVHVTGQAAMAAVLDVDDHLRKLLLRAQVIIDEAMGRHITNHAMLQHPTVSRQPDPDAHTHCAAGLRMLPGVPEDTMWLQCAAKKLCVMLRAYAQRFSSELATSPFAAMEPDAMQLELTEAQCIDKGPHNTRSRLGADSLGRQAQSPAPASFDMTS
nr:unnamed protein product [Digitaria exilis]